MAAPSAPAAIAETSSNGRMRGGTSLANGKKVKVLFFPDQHLGRNTAHAMGYPLERMVVWDPRQDLGGNSATL